MSDEYEAPLPKGSSWVTATCSCGRRFSTWGTLREMQVEADLWEREHDHGTNNGARFHMNIEEKRG